MALALAIALPACGGGGATTATEPTPTEATVFAPSAEGEAVPAGRPAAGAKACASHLEGFLDQLDHLRRSLAIGVSYEQYVAELATLRRSYEQVPVGKLDLACVSGAAASAESSFDGYLAAANTWGECVSDTSCQTADLEPRLQREWHAAAAKLAAAQRALTSG